MFDKFLKFRNRVQVYLVNTIWIMAEKIFNMGVCFLVLILLARHLGAEQFGILSYSISLVAVFAMAGHVGLSGLVVRELVKHPEARQEVMGTSFVLKGIGYLTGLVLLLIFSLLSEELNSTQFWLLFILSLSLLLHPFDVIEFWFQSRLEARYTSMSKMIALVFSAALSVFLVYTNAQLVFFAFANVLQVMIAMILMYVLYTYNTGFSIKRWSVSISRAKHLAQQGWVIFLGSIFAVIYLKVDQIMLKWLVDSKEVGVYAIAASLSEAWYFVPVAIVSSFFPKLIILMDHDQELYKIRLQQLFDLLFMLALIVAVIITLLAEPIILFVFGPEYSASSEILVVHIWAAIFIFMRAAFSKWILIENVLMFSLITQGLGAVVNVALNFILIPHYGGLGAAYATLFSYATASYLSLVLYSRSRIVFNMMTLAMFAPVRYLVKGLGH
jgi:O-antigen/teichoic acid export membrane protein